MLSPALVKKSPRAGRRIAARRTPLRDCTSYNNGGRARGGPPKVVGGLARVVEARPVWGGGLGGREPGFSFLLGAPAAVLETKYYWWAHGRRRPPESPKSLARAARARPIQAGEEKGRGCVARARNDLPRCHWREGLKGGFRAPQRAPRCRGPAKAPGRGSSSRTHTDAWRHKQSFFGPQTCWRMIDRLGVSGGGTQGGL